MHPSATGSRSRRARVGIYSLTMLRGDRNLQCSSANDSRGEQSKSKVIGSMRKVHLVCSLLLAFSASVFGVGCDAKKPDNKMSGPAPAVDASKAADGVKATGKKPKASGEGSTTGGGVEVPAAGGTTEKPADVKPADEKPADAKAVEEKAPEAKPEEKTEAKAEEKAEEKKPE